MVITLPLIYLEQVYPGVFSNETAILFQPVDALT